MTMTISPRSEYNEQCTLVEYLDLLKATGKILMYTALPNNLFTKSWSQKVKQKRQGLKPGFPDLVIVTKDKVIFLEMKRVRGGVLSDEQMVWLEALKGKQTVSGVAKGFDKAKAYLDEVLG